MNWFGCLHDYYITNCLWTRPRQKNLFYKKKKKKIHWKVWAFVALVNSSVICLFLCSFLRAWVTKLALRSCAEIIFCWAQLKSFAIPHPSQPPRLLTGVGEDTVVQRSTARVRGEDSSQIHHLVGWCSFFTYSLPTVLARANGHEFWGWLPVLQTL